MVSFQNFKMVDRGQFKDLHEPSNQNVSVEQAEENFNSFRFHRFKFFRESFAAEFAARQQQAKQFGE